MPLNGKKALVTGGGRGIGQAVSLALAGAGADVAIFELDETTARDTAAAIEKTGRQALILTADVSRFSDVQANTEKVSSLWDAIDIVVDNAGITRDTLLIRMSEEDWDEAMAPRGVRVNAIAPGFIQTAMTDKIPTGLKEKMIDGIPLGRMGKPEDAARAVLFLASPAADYITGQVLVVDGGMYM